MGPIWNISELKFVGRAASLRSLTSTLKRRKPLMHSLGAKGDCDAARRMNGDIGASNRARSMHGKK